MAGLTKRSPSYGMGYEREDEILHLRSVHEIMRPNVGPESVKHPEGLFELNQALDELPEVVGGLQEREGFHGQGDVFKGEGQEHILPKFP